AGQDLHLAKPPGRRVLVLTQQPHDRVLGREPAGPVLDGPPPAGTHPFGVREHRLQWQRRHQRGRIAHPAEGHGRTTPRTSGRHVAAIPANVRKEAGADMLTQRTPSVRSIPVSALLSPTSTQWSTPDSSRMVRTHLTLPVNCSMRASTIVSSSVVGSPVTLGITGTSGGR